VNARLSQHISNTIQHEDVPINSCTAQNLKPGASSPGKYASAAKSYGSCCGAAFLTPSCCQLPAAYLSHCCRRTQCFDSFKLAEQPSHKFHSRKHATNSWGSKAAEQAHPRKHRQVHDHRETLLPVESEAATGVVTPGNANSLQAQLHHCNSISFICAATRAYPEAYHD
jgi:hypothetical protein